MKLYANCSEAIFRLKTDKLKASEKEKLDEVIKEFEKDEEMWGETDSEDKEIFGIKCIEINGTAPHHHGEDIEKELKKLKFFKKLELERDEA